MEYYLSLALLYAIGSIVELHKSKMIKNRKLLTFFLLLPMFLLVAFRAETIGTDTIVYYDGFQAIKNYSLSSVLRDSRMENGYMLLSYLFVNNNLSFLYMQIFISIFIYFSIYTFICRYSPNISFSCFLFLTLKMMFGSMNIVRMYIAMAILLFSIPYIHKRRVMPFTIICLSATLFHSSAIIFLMLYPLSLWQYKHKYKLIFLGGIVIALLGNTFFSIATSTTGLYEGYMDTDYFDGSSKLGSILNLLISLSFFCFLRASLVRSNSRKYYDKGLSIASICYTAVILIIAFNVVGLTNSIMARLYGYFNFAWLILIPLGFINMRNIIYRYFLAIIMMVLLVAQMVVSLIYRPGWFSVVPYELGI